MASTLETCANTGARPGSPSAGDTVYQEDTKQIITYDGSSWQEYESDGTGGYDLDGTNVMTGSPLFHFDAGFINGVDATGNPSNAASFTGQWTSKIGGKTTVAQGTAGSQPTFYTSGENSKPYLSFDGGDHLNLTAREYCETDFTMLTIAISGTTNGFFGPLSSKGEDDAVMTDTFRLGGNGLFYGYNATQTLIFYSRTENGYPGASTHTVGKTYNGETRSVIFRRNASGGTAYMDGDNPASPNTLAADNDVRFGSIGRGQLGMTGFIYEILLFDSYLSDADLNSWGAYVTTKYAAGGSAMEAQDDF